MRLIAVNVDSDERLKTGQKAGFYSSKTGQYVGDCSEKPSWRALLLSPLWVEWNYELSRNITDVKGSGFQGG